ncbi:hypothetical protein PR202_ga13762 [Eleusine coracana subsp. coracana]|uniref:N-acetyltransferase domain-containing protein n=1 Tax=Eleusine coracana subsp. coracana TaxID=191504 RepID=A0AAV5CF59_ELECO|nr:hypothetical protein PR202_ga13762 [Eleusine coracana subsp. coracana]
MDQEKQVARPAAVPSSMKVTLRPFELSDVDAMMAWASDPVVAAPCRWDAYESTEPLLAFIRDAVLRAVFNEVDGELVDNPTPQRVAEKAGLGNQEGAVLRKYFIKGRRSQGHAHVQLHQRPTRCSNDTLVCDKTFCRRVNVYIALALS